MTTQTSSTSECAQAPKLSPACQCALDAIRAYWEEHGIPPTIRDVMLQAGLASTSSAHYHVARLEAAGWITRKPRAARSIRIVEPVP